MKQPLKVKGKGLFQNHICYNIQWSDGSTSQEPITKLTPELLRMVEEWEMSLVSRDKDELERQKKQMQREQEEEEEPKPKPKRKFKLFNSWRIKKYGLEEEYQKQLQEEKEEHEKVLANFKGDIVTIESDTSEDQVCKKVKEQEMDNYYKKYPFLVRGSKKNDDSDNDAKVKCKILGYKQVDGEDKILEFKIIFQDQDHEQWIRQDELVTKDPTTLCNFLMQHLRWKKTNRKPKQEKHHEEEQQQQQQQQQHKSLIDQEIEEIERQEKQNEDINRKVRRKKFKNKKQAEGGEEQEEQNNPDNLDQPQPQSPSGERRIRFRPRDQEEEEENNEQKEKDQHYLKQLSLLTQQETFNLHQDQDSLDLKQQINIQIASGVANQKQDAPQLEQDEEQQQQPQEPLPDELDIIDDHHFDLPIMAPYLTEEEQKEKDKHHMEEEKQEEKSEEQEKPQDKTKPDNGQAETYEFPLFQLEERDDSD